MSNFSQRILLSGALAVILFTLDRSRLTGAVAADWSLERSEEPVNAFINLTYYVQEEKKVHTEKSEVGRFGSGKIGSAYGIVIHVRSRNRSDEHDGCDYPFGNLIPNDTAWIALIRRGNCTFEKKLENAYKSKASAMVVYDTDIKDELERMDLKPGKHNYAIPGVLTYKWKGEEIANLVDNGTSVTMYITVGETRPPFNGINRTSVLFVSISFIVLMIISLAWLVFYYVQRFRYLHAKDRLAQRLCNAAKKALAKIPTRNIKLTDKEMNSSEGECCAVCIEAYRSGDTLRTLPCKHEFHKTCVDPWLLEHRTCPMCKMDILKYYGYIFTGSQESILHLDLDDNVMNSFESRETDSPPQEPRHHHTSHLTAQMEDHPQSSVSSSFPSQQTLGSMRKPSLISLTVVAAPRGSITTPVASESGADVDASSKGSVNSSRARLCSAGGVGGGAAGTHENQHPMCFISSSESRQSEPCPILLTEEKEKEEVKNNTRMSRAASLVSSAILTDDGPVEEKSAERSVLEESSLCLQKQKESNKDHSLVAETKNEISQDKPILLSSVSVQIEEDDDQRADKCDGKVKMT